MQGPQSLQGQSESGWTKESAFEKCDCLPRRYDVHLIRYGHSTQRTQRVINDAATKNVFLHFIPPWLTEQAQRARKMIVALQEDLWCLKGLCVSTIPRKNRVCRNRTGPEAVARFDIQESES